MKYLILSVLTLVVLSCVLLPNLSTQALAQVNSSFLTYTNTDMGFTMKYPSDWTIDDKNVSNDGIMFTSPDGPRAGMVTVTAKETGNTTEEIAKAGEDFINSPQFNQLHGFKLIEMDKSGYFLSGHPALRSISQVSFGELGDFKIMGYMTILGGKRYDIGYTAPAESFTNVLQTAQTMIDSFQIISKQ